jgi:hypothetical protein
MATEYADFSIRGKAELTFNPNGSKTETSSSMSKDITDTVMALWKASILLHLDFWGSNNEAVGKSNMYEFMIGQEFLRIKQLILCLECQPIGRSTYCAAPAYIG